MCFIHTGHTFGSSLTSVRNDLCHTFEDVMPHIIEFLVKHEVMSHIESCHTWSHVTHEVMSHINSCHTSSYVTHRLSWKSTTVPSSATSCLRATAAMSMIFNSGSFAPVAWWYEGVMSHIRTSHVAHMNELWCHTYEWDMSHMRTIYVTLMSESCYTYERVMSHSIWMSHVTDLNESCHTTYAWLMSHMWKSYVTHMNESCPTTSPVTQINIKWVVSHLWSHVTHMNEPCHTRERVISRNLMCPGSKYK